MFLLCAKGQGWLKLGGVGTKPSLPLKVHMLHLGPGGVPSLCVGSLTSQSPQCDPLSRMSLSQGANALHAGWHTEIAKFVLRSNWTEAPISKNKEAAFPEGL